jgi:hypothetical protein
MLPNLILSVLYLSSAAFARVASPRAAKHSKSSTLKLTRNYGKSSPSSRHLRKRATSSTILPLDDPAMEVEFATNVACKSHFRRESPSSDAVSGLHIDAPLSRKLVAVTMLTMFPTVGDEAREVIIDTGSSDTWVSLTIHSI